MSGAPVQLRRDPFARSTLMRQRAPVQGAETCAWCGSHARFRYRWENDASGGSMIPWHKLRLFCSVQCWETFHR